MFMENFCKPWRSIKLESAVSKDFSGNAGSFRTVLGMGNLLLPTRISSTAQTIPSAQRCKSPFFPKNHLLFQVFPGKCLTGPLWKTSEIPVYPKVLSQPRGNAFTHFGNCLLQEDGDLWNCSKQDWETRSRQLPIPRILSFPQKQKGDKICLCH